jgi:hypothetical protein
LLLSLVALLLVECELLATLSHPSFAYYLFEMMSPSMRDEAIMATGNVEADYCIFQEQELLIFPDV